MRWAITKVGVFKSDILVIGTGLQFYSWKNREACTHVLRMKIPSSSIHPKKTGGRWTVDLSSSEADHVIQPPIAQRSLQEVSSLEYSTPLWAPGLWRFTYPASECRALRPIVGSSGKTQRASKTGRSCKGQLSACRKPRIQSKTTPEDHHDYYSTYIRSYSQTLPFAFHHLYFFQQYSLIVLYIHLLFPCICANLLFKRIISQIVPIQTCVLSSSTPISSSAHNFNPGSKKLIASLRHAFRSFINPCFLRCQCHRSSIWRKPLQHSQWRISAHGWQSHYCDLEANHAGHRDIDIAKRCQQ